MADFIVNSLNDIGGDGNTIWDSVTITGKVEEGFDIDGSNNFVSINNSNLGGFCKKIIGSGVISTGNGFDIDGSNNSVPISNSLIIDNGDNGLVLNRISWCPAAGDYNIEQGFEIYGTDNTVFMNGSDLSGNGENNFFLNTTSSGNVITIFSSTISTIADLSISNAVNVI